MRSIIITNNTTGSEKISIHNTRWQNSAVLFREHQTESLQLTLVLQGDSAWIVDVVVDGGLVLDVLGAIGELERGEGLGVTFESWGDAGDEGRLAVAAERVGEGVGQLR